MKTVEEWLAAGNKTTVLDMGFTAFKDGKVPMGAKQKKAVETPAHVIKEKNKAIRKAKYKPVAKKDPELLIQMKNEQMSMLSNFYKDMPHVDKRRFAAVCGIAPKTLDNARTGNTRISAKRWEIVKLEMAQFKFSEYDPKIKVNGDSRRARVIEARRNAQANGETVYLAECKHHGLVNYYLKEGQHGRCSLCQIELNKKSRNKAKSAEQLEKDERAEENRGRMEKALSGGCMAFIGICAEHGETEMMAVATKGLAIGYSYRCLICNTNSHRRYREKRRSVK